MKNQSKTIVGLILIMTMMIIFVFGTGFVSPNFTNQTQVQQTDETIKTVSVNGMGEVQAEPDTAIIWLGVQTEAETAADALEENNQKMQDLIDSLIDSGINERDIQTKTLNLYPRYDQDQIGNNRTFVGYTASNTVEVRTNDIDSLGTLMDDAVEAGANTIDNIRFEISDNQALIEQAREAAVMDALAKAEQLASLTGATLGEVQTIQESSSTPSPVAREESFSQVSAVPVAPGSESIRIQVQITWILITDN